MTLSDTVGISQQLRKGSGGYDETCFANNKHRLGGLGWVSLCQEGSRGRKCPVCGVSLNQLCDQMLKGWQWEKQTGVSQTCPDES